MTAIGAALGPVMLDLSGTDLTPDERALLSHPLVGGVILFARNFASCEQLTRLTADIHALRTPSLLIAVDHEGGRVQRFREGFTRLPPMRALGVLWDADPSAALEAARATGYVLAMELRAVGVDLSFTPVLDLEYGSSSVIGDRAFHGQPETVSSLAGALVDGLRGAGMGSVGKHYPGHGFVAADSHVAVPIDNRPFEEIMATDLLPYRRLGDKLAAVMPAHVVYDRVDPMPAGFSAHWLRKVLRGELGFDGAIFSDDLSMEGASVAGGIVERAHAAVAAGCDVALVCNALEAARGLLDSWQPRLDPASAQRLARLIPHTPTLTQDALQTHAPYREALAAMERIPPMEVRGDGCRPAS